MSLFSVKLEKAYLFLGMQNLFLLKEFVSFRSMVAELGLKNTICVSYCPQTIKIFYLIYRGLLALRILRHLEEKDMQKESIKLVVVGKVQVNYTININILKTAIHNVLRLAIKVELILLII